LKGFQVDKRRLKQDLIAYSFILPNFIGFAVFTLFPMLFSMILTFLNWDGANPITFAGLNNFKRLFTDETFRIALFNTFYYTLTTVPVTVVCSLGLAVLLNKPIAGRNIFRGIFFFPHVASLVAIAAVWNAIFHPTMGPVNQLLQSWGIANPPKWSASTTWALPTVIMASIWKSIGYYMIIYLAGLQGIPRDLYEVAKIDGANAWTVFTKITLPMLRPTTFFILVILTINCFKVFDLIYVMTGGGPGRASTVLVLHIYNVAFKEYRFGYSSTIALVLFVIVLIITVFQFKLEKKWVTYMQ
jgi:multiple sugar transport system permease protein